MRPSMRSILRRDGVTRKKNPPTDRIDSIGEFRIWISLRGEERGLWD
jgi:hypothetical protein